MKIEIFMILKAVGTQTSHVQGFESPIIASTARIKRALKNSAEAVGHSARDRFARDLACQAVQVLFVGGDHDVFDLFGDIWILERL